MCEETREFFRELCANINDFDKESLNSYPNRILHILSENEITDFFENLSLLALGTQISYLTNHYKKDLFKKKLCTLISTEGKNYFNDEMNYWLDMAEAGFSAEGENICFADNIDFTSSFFSEFCDFKCENYNQIIFNLRSVANGRFNPDDKNFFVCFALYFIILGFYYDFPDNDVKILIDLLNYYIIVPEKRRLERFNGEIERFFSNYINIGFSERRYFYTDLPFIYQKIAEKKKESDNEITIVSKNKPPVKLKIKNDISSEFQTVSKSLEFLLLLESILNPDKKNEIRYVLFERVFFNKRRFQTENPEKEEKIFLMKQMPAGFYKIPANTKIHHESALSLFFEVIKVFKIIGEKNELETGKHLFGLPNIYQGTLNLEHGVASLLYMLLKEMSFDDVKEIFSDSKDGTNSALMEKILEQYGETNIKSSVKSDNNKAILLQQMLFFMFWEICTYSYTDSKDKHHPFEKWLENPKVFNDKALDFSYCLHPFGDFQNPEIQKQINSLMLNDLIRGNRVRPSFSQYVEYRDPFWWKTQLFNILNYNAFKSHLNSSDAEKRAAFSDDFDILKLKDRSLLIELLFRFSRTEPEFKENIIAMLNHLREVQKEFIPIYYDSKEKSYNDDALKNQEKLKSIDMGFFIPVIYQSLYPFNTEEFITKYNEELFLCRFNVECRIFQESYVSLQIDDRNKITQNYRETNKTTMYTRCLYLDRNIYVHNGTNRAINELLKPSKCRDLLFTLSDILSYFDFDFNRYADDKFKKVFAEDKLFSAKNHVCAESIKAECKMLASLIMKIAGSSYEEINSSIIKEFADSLSKNFTIDYNSPVSKEEFLRERLERLLNIMFLTYEPDFNAHTIDFLIEHKTPVLLYIASVTFKLLPEIEKNE